MGLRPSNIQRARALQRLEPRPTARQLTCRGVWALAGVVLLALSVVAGFMVPPGAPEQVAGAGTEVAPIRAAADPAESVDLDTVAAGMDAAIAEAMAQHDIPGGVFVLVADGAIAHAEGYGHTDLDRDMPVDAQRTRFDIGSVSKLLTATAVMQQVEQGTLDLHTDVNDYLADLEIPDTFDEPATAAHLLTHTAGFGEYYLLGSAAPGPGEADPLADSLSRYLPPRIRSPGIAHQYDNYGFALAGHLVENVTGETFESYVTASILEPLGMTRSTYGRPVPDADDVIPHEAVPGLDAAGPVPPMHVNSLPTGGLWTTGEDVAAFMLAYLGDGEYDGIRVLQPDTVAAMHRTQFTPHPDLAGIGYGFFEHIDGERRGVQHGGSWVGASAHLYLLPDADLGFFVAFNHGAGVEVTHTLIYDALDELVPVAAPPVAAPPVADPPASGNDASDVAGQYRWNRHDRFTFMRLVSTLAGIRLQVTANDDGTLDTAMAPARLLPDTRWTASEPGVFVEQNGTSTLVFESDETGEVVGLHVAGPQLFSMDRLAWYETTGFVLALLLAFLAVALIAAVGWPTGAIHGRLRRRRGDTPTGVRRARRLGGLAGGLLIAFVLGLVGQFVLDMGGLLRVGLAVRALLWLPLASIALTAGLAFIVIRLWRNGEGSTAGRVYYSGIVLVLLASIPFLYHLRLLGFHY
jgi:CubicO group peptidase (beta-lactamase class C family)